MLNLRPLMARAGWGLADQALSSLTNFVLGLIVVRTFGVEEFGAFSLAFALYLVVINISRAYPMGPLPIRYGVAPDGEFRQAGAAAVGSMLGIGVAGAVVLLLIGLIVGGTAGQAYVALALTFPGLLVQDAWRWTFFAWRRGRSAFLNDLVCAIALLALLAPVLALGGQSVFWPTLAWGVSASVAALFGWRQSRIRPDPRLARAWWREHLDIGPRFIAEVVSRTAGGLLSTYGIGLVAGLTTVGILRAAQLLMGPVQIFFLGISLVAVPEGVRALDHSRERLRRLAVGMSVALMGLAAGWGVLMLLVPVGIGTALLGDSWDQAQLVLVPVIAAQVFTVASTGPGMGLRALAAARRNLHASLVVSSLFVVLGVAGAAIEQTSGAAWGLAIAATISAAIWWRAFLAALADHARSSEPILNGATREPA